MSSFYDDASLVVIPSGYKTSKVYAEKPTDGSGDLAFTRTGDTATRVNSEGLIEKVRTNLILQSQTFDNASWSKATVGGTITVTANYGTAPDGTTTADRIQLSAPSAGTYADVLQVISLTSGRPTTYSVYLKALTGTPTIIFYNDGVTGNKTITLTSDWVRYTFSVQSSGTEAYPRFACENGVTSSSADILAWGAQLETSDVATAYIATTTAAVSVGPVANVPRLDYTGSTCPRLLLEPQRTNKITYSENQGPTGTNWYPSTTWTVTNNAVVSPSGYQDADTLTETTSTGFHSSYFNATIETAYTGTYTISAFAKYNGRIFVLNPDPTGAGRTYFDLQNGTVLQAGTGVTAKIENYGNGWYRCICTASFSSQNVIFEHMLASAVGTLQYTGNGTSGVHIWGCQAEAGAYATSYIPTLAATATRGDELLTKTSISSLIGQVEGTLLLEFDFVVGEQANYGIIYDAGFNSYIYVNQQTLGNIVGQIQPYGIAFSTAKTNGKYRCAIAYKSGDSAFFVNGVQIGSTNTTTFTLNTMDRFTFLNSDNTKAIHQALLFKTRLTNAQLAELTTL